MTFLCVVRLSLVKGSWPTLALALGLVFLDQLGLGHLGSCWLMYCGLFDLLTNRCLETPRDHNPDKYQLSYAYLDVLNTIPCYPLSMIG